MKRCFFSVRLRYIVFESFVIIVAYENAARVAKFQDEKKKHKLERSNAPQRIPHFHEYEWRHTWTNFCWLSQFIGEILTKKKIRIEQIDDQSDEINQNWWACKGRWLSSLYFATNQIVSHVTESFSSLYWTIASSMFRPPWQTIAVNSNVSHFHFNDDNGFIIAMNRSIPLIIVKFIPVLFCIVN